MNMTKKYFLALSMLMILAVSCMERPSRPKNSAVEEDVTISLGDGSTVSIPVDTSDYWQDNEKLIEIYSNQMAGNYIYDGSLYDTGLRYKFADNLDMVDPKNNTVYKKYIKTILVKVNDKENQLLDSSLNGKYVAGAVYQVVLERGKDDSGYDESIEENQPAVGGYEIVLNNYGRTDYVKPPYSDVREKLHILYRYNLPASEANSNYNPEKVFNETYKRIGSQKDEDRWFILPKTIYTKK